MKICVAQIRPVKGYIESNIAAHKTMITTAAKHNAGVIIFPELSITGYEPELAKNLATTKDDNRFDGLQQLSDNYNITIGAGMPLQATGGVMIGMLIFTPHQPRQVYTKQYLHSDELPYFISGNQQPFLGEGNNKIAMAICYEISIPAHPENACNNNARIYIASVAKSVTGIEKALATLAETAAQYNMLTLLSNCVGYCDNFDCGGKSSVWGNDGTLLAQLNGTDEGLLMVDTETKKVVEEFFS